MTRNGTPEQLGLPEISGGEWYTPDWLFRELNDLYGPFTLDAAALPTNAKCEEYFTPEQDGRVQSWHGVVFCNPPYYRLIEWVKKAHDEVKVGRAERAVLLLPAHTSTDWFHDYALPHAQMHWIRRKVKFGGRAEKALMPSVAVIFDGKTLRDKRPAGGSLRPYYDEGGTKIFHGDFRDGAESFADCNLVIADPPYGETSLDWDVWPSGWPKAIVAAMPKTASMWCFGSARMFLERSSEFSDFRLAQDVVWEKQNGSGFIDDRFKRVHGAVYQFVRKGARWSDVYNLPQYTSDATRRTIRRKDRPSHMGDIGGATFESHDGGPRLARSVIYCRNCYGQAMNETQKPTEVVGLLARSSCPPGGLIVSPFMGSGTDLVVARSHGMRAIGFDIREEQCEAAAKRLAQGSLFQEAA